MSNIDNSQLESDIRDLLAKLLEIDKEKITPEAHLVEDLGADSMQALEIMVALDKKYKINIEEADLPKMTSLQKITGIVRNLTK